MNTDLDPAPQMPTLLGWRASRRSFFFGGQRTDISWATPLYDFQEWVAPKELRKLQRADNHSLAEWLFAIWIPAAVFALISILGNLS